MRKEIDTALAIDPRHIDTLLVDMMFSFKAPSIAGGDRKKAFRIADRIQSISAAWGYLAHARLLQDGTDDKTTEQMLLKAVAVAPTFYRAHASLARFYCCTAQNKRPELAEKAALRALAVDPNGSQAYEVLARVYAQQERWADLDKLLQRAEHAIPDDLAPYYSAAQGCFDAGKDFARGRRYLEHYFAQPVEGRQPTHAQGRWLLGRMYEREGRRADAIRELEMAVRQDPELEGAKKDLKRLRQG
jgi:tetratricopeptide (TPR) repeat protein